MQTQNLIDQIVLHYWKVNICIFTQIHQLRQDLLLILLLVMAVGAARLNVVIVPHSCHHLGCILAGVLGHLLSGF